MSDFFSAQKGLGLIELMISITLGLFLISGTIGVLTSGKSSYTLNNELTWIQDNARFATSTIKKDIRMAGFFGCGSSNLGSFNSTLNPSSEIEWQFEFDKPIFGWDGDDEGYPTPEFPASYNTGSILGMPNSDLLTIRHGGGRNFAVESNKPVTRAVIVMAGAHPFVGGDILVITDCDQTTVFQVTGNNNPMQIVHNTGQGSPGNCSKALGNFECAADGSNGDVGHTFLGEDGAFILRLSAHAYFVSEGADGTPSLFHREVVTHSGDSGTEDEELAQGVENMQVFYGFDSDMDDNVEVHRYVNADDLDSSGSDWSYVRAVRVHFLFRSLTQAASQPQPFRFVGQTFTPNDRFLRQEYIATVQIRN